MKLRNAITMMTAATLVAASAGLMAADGTLGTTSSGSKAVSVTVPTLVAVTGIADVTFGSYAGTGNLTNGDAMCVYRNASGTYSVTLTSGNPDGSNNFRLYDGSANYIVYGVEWNDGSTNAAAASGSALAARANANTTSQTCSSHASDNATLTVTVTEANLQAAPPTSYSDTITILVSPT